MSKLPSVSLGGCPQCESHDWYRAFTLLERQALIPDCGPHTAAAADAIDRWRAEYPFDDDACFAQRLAAVSISERDFGALLSLPLETIALNVPVRPHWLEELLTAFCRTDLEPRESWPANFSPAIEPLLDLYRIRLREGVRKLLEDREKPAFDARTVEDLFLGNLHDRLLWMSGRTLVLELNVARLDGSLSGSTAETRFASFIQRLAQRETALKIFQEYPVLARQLVLGAAQWLDYCLEFLAHLSADFGALGQTFAPDRELGMLVEVRNEAGDRHRNGRSVLIAEFSSGLKLVYKPRSLAVDLHFNELLAWANDKGFSPGFRKTQVLDRGSYGWVEFIDTNACTTLAEVERFYRRQGGNLALLYALGATDFHHENLIACGEHPVLVDLEALFSPCLSRVESGQAHQAAADALLNSVMRTGLLPQAAPEAPDFSGLGTVEGRLSPFGVPQWEQVATDEMRYLRKSVPMRGAANRPTLASVPADPFEHQGSIADGFRAMYRLLMAHRQEALADNGPLAAFANDEVRVVLRATRTYAHLLEESFHPDVLRDALERDYLFDRLWVSVAQLPLLARVTVLEQMSLQEADIPIFTTRPNSRDLWAGSGTCIPEFVQESGLMNAMQRVRELGEAHLERQLWLIRASLATQAVGASANGVAAPPNRRVINARSEELLEFAIAVGDRLEALAVHGNGGVAWIGLATTGNRQWSLVPAGADLYDGLPGIALFLAYLGAVSGQDRFTGLARGALTTFRRQVEVERTAKRSIGGFAGWGGVIYALTHLAVLWHDADLVAEAERIVVESLPDLLDQDPELDIIGGAAGCILSLLGLHRISGSQSALATAIRCGDVLVARATAQAVGSAWPNEKLGRRPLVGFSHGTAGMAYALTQLSAHAHPERYHATARAALAYERSLFDAMASNWPDLRELDAPHRTEKAERDSSPVAWCHGAAGIGLSRLQMSTHFDDPALRPEIEAALRATLAWGFADDHSLCHGALGNLEFLVGAGQALAEPEIASLVDRIKLEILQSMVKEGWKCGLPLSVETPGLMTGLAGIGYGLLRLAEPSRVPSLLLLAPPAAQP